MTGKERTLALPRGLGIAFGVTMVTKKGLAKRDFRFEDGEQPGAEFEPALGKIFRTVTGRVRRREIEAVQVSDMAVVALALSRGGDAVEREVATS